MGSQPLPSSVEQLLEAIRVEKSIEPADPFARRELARIGEELAVEILQRISQTTSIKKSLSAFIIFMVRKYATVHVIDGEPMTPERHRPEPAYSQESVNFSGPSNSDFGWNRDDQNACSTSSRMPLYDVLPSQPQPACSVSPVHSAFTMPPRKPADSSPQWQPPNTIPPRQIVNTVPDWQLFNTTPPRQPVSTVPQWQACTTSLNQPVGIVPLTRSPCTVPTRPTSSAVMEALGELEFRKAFLILSYVGRGKVDDIISLDLIRELKCLGMRTFEQKLWDTVRRQGCIPESDRRKNLDWDSKRTHIYHCHVELSGSLTFKGPFLQDTSTHLQQVLGDDNVLMVKLTADHNHSDYYPFYHAIAEEGIFLGLRRYRFFVFKDGGKEERTKSPTSSPVKCYFVRTESYWAMDVCRQYILDNKSIQEARSIFMHVHTLPSVEKYMARFSLILSKTIKLDVDFASVKVEHIDDIPCVDEGGQVVHNEDGDIMIHTDGTGFISEDLAKRCPQRIWKGRYVTPRDIQNFWDGAVATEGDSCLKQSVHLEIEPPLLMQFRLFYNGIAAKGTALVDKTLPPETIKIRPSMIKVHQDSAISSGSYCNSLEIVGTSNLSRRTRLSKSVIALLHYGGVPEECFLDLTSKALLDAKDARHSKKSALKVALSHGNMDDFLAARMILSGMPLHEPYLEHRLSLMMREEVKGIKAGKIPVNDCYHLMGTADPTGKLGPNEVCIILDKGQVSGKVLVYKHPGLHFGDIHVLTAVYVEDIVKIVGNAKFAIFFPIKGRRSLADEMANSDFDGDLYWVSRNPQFLEHFKPASPWNWCTSKPRESQQKKPTEFSSTDLERALFQKFLDNRFNPSYTMGEASDSWMAYMDRMLTSCVSAVEKQRLHEKLLKLIDIYYRALDAPKKGLKVEVPSYLKSEKYPHYLERSKSCFHSISILGVIYDKVNSFQVQEPLIDVSTEVKPLDCLSEQPPQHCMEQWSKHYDEYRKEMALALKETDEKLKSLAAEQVTQKYKWMLYGAEEFEKSTKNQSDVLDEALAIYHVVYNHVNTQEKKVSSCGFAWKIAGHAILESFRQHAIKQKADTTIVCLKSVLQEVLG